MHHYIPDFGITIVLIHCLSFRGVCHMAVSDLFPFLFKSTLNNIYLISIHNAAWRFWNSVLLMDLGTIIKQANLKNCGPSPSNKFDLEVGQRSRSSHGTNRKGFSQGSCMPNINALSLILQKIWAMLKFLWQTDWGTDRQTDEFQGPLFSQKAGDNYTVETLRWT